MGKRPFCGFRAGKSNVGHADAASDVSADASKSMENYSEKSPTMH